MVSILLFALKDLDLFYDQFWSIKCVVLEGQMTTMGTDENIKEKMFSLNLKDYTGNLNIGSWPLLNKYIDFTESIMAIQV